MRWRLHARSVRSRARLFQGHSGRARSSAPGRLLRFALQEIRKMKARALRAMSAVFSSALASAIWSPPHSESRNNQINSYVQDTYVQDHLRQSPTGEGMLPRGRTRVRCRPRPLLHAKAFPWRPGSKHARPQGRTPRLCAKAISGGSGVASCIHWTTAAARSGPSPRIMRQQR